MKDWRIQGVVQISPLEQVRKKSPEKFTSEEEIFGHIHRGERIFIASACEEPQYPVQAIINYVKSFDAEVIHVWKLGVAPYNEERFKYNFRHNSFCTGNSTRSAVNQGLAHYTPTFLSEVPSCSSGKRRLSK